MVPESEEIREAMKETRGSAPGLDGVRFGYIRKACEDIQARMIEIVQSRSVSDVGFPIFADMDADFAF